MFWTFNSDLIPLYIVVPVELTGIRAIKKRIDVSAFQGFDYPDSPISWARANGRALYRFAEFIRHVELKECSGGPRQSWTWQVLYKVTFIESGDRFRAELADRTFPTALGVKQFNTGCDRGVPEKKFLATTARSCLAKVWRLWHVPHNLLLLYQAFCHRRYRLRCCSDTLQL